jgi:hypothetical protein
MAFGDEFISMFNPNGGYGSGSNFDMGANMDWAPEISSGDPSSGWMGYGDNFGNVQLGGETYMGAPSWNTSVASDSNFGMPASTDWAPEIARGDSSSGLMGYGDSSFLDSMWKKYTDMPFDKQVGMGMGVLSGLGSAAQMMQQNKLAKKARKANEKMSAYQIAAMQRQQRNAAINDRLNNSYDTTTAATVDYKPLTREQAMSYGETGAPHQQLTITPGVTTRNYLADGGLPSGGQEDNVHAMLSEGEFVIPADVVSALGDGNTKAGASALHQMMQSVRKNARSGTIDKIPPKVKTPMSYIKKGMK